MMKYTRQTMNEEGRKGTVEEKGTTNYIQMKVHNHYMITT